MCTIWSCAYESVRGINGGALQLMLMLSGCAILTCLIQLCILTTSEALKRMQTRAISVFSFTLMAPCKLKYTGWCRPKYAVLLLYVCRCYLVLDTDNCMFPFSVSRRSRDERYCRIRFVCCLLLFVVYKETPLCFRSENINTLNRGVYVIIQLDIQYIVYSTHFQNY